MAASRRRLGRPAPVWQASPRLDPRSGPSRLAIEDGLPQSLEIWSPAQPDFQGHGTERGRRMAAPRRRLGRPAPVWQARPRLDPRSGPSRLAIEDGLPQSLEIWSPAQPAFQGDGTERGRRMAAPRRRLGRPAPVWQARPRLDPRSGPSRLAIEDGLPQSLEIWSPAQPAFQGDGTERGRRMAAPRRRLGRPAPVWQARPRLDPRSGPSRLAIEDGLPQSLEIWSPAQPDFQGHGTERGRRMAADPWGVQRPSAKPAGAWIPAWGPLASPSRTGCLNPWKSGPQRSQPSRARALNASPNGRPPSTPGAASVHSRSSSLAPPCLIFSAAVSEQGSRRLRLSNISFENCFLLLLLLVGAPTGRGGWCFCRALGRLTCVQDMMATEGCVCLLLLLLESVVVGINCMYLVEQGTFEQRHLLNRSTNNAPSVCCCCCCCCCNH